MTDARQAMWQNRLVTEIETFKQQIKTLALATVDEQGVPNVSYAPFVIDNGEYQVLISTVARHARNLMQMPKLSLMLIEDEAASSEIFARRRLTFDATARMIARDSAEWQTGIDKLKARHGVLVEKLIELGDFKLFSFKVHNGLFVKGFGKAFHIDAGGAADLVHIDEGHKKGVD